MPEDGAHDAFHLEEYKTLRKEIEIGVEELRRSRRNALIAAFAIYAWLATGGLFGQSAPNSEVAQNLARLAWWLPILIPVFGFVEYLGIMARIMDAAAYIQRLETHYASEEMKGWENYLGSLRSDKPFVARAQGWSGFILWPLLFAITIIVALQSQGI